MGYNINEALERLENNLKDISSAKEQVENIVSSNEDIRNVISKYVCIIESFNCEVRNLMSELKECQECSVSNFSEKLEKLQKAMDNYSAKMNKDLTSCVTDFNKHVNASVIKFSDEVVIFHKEIENLKSVSTAADKVQRQTNEIVVLLNGLSGNVKEIFDENVKSLTEINANIKSITDNEKVYYDALNERLSEISACFSLLQNGIDKMNDNLDTKYKSVYTGISENRKSIKMIDDSLSKLSSEIDSFKSNMTTNRILLVVLFIVTVILHFL